MPRGRPAWQGSDRRDRIPADWPARRDEADRLNPGRICHWCGEPGGSDLDHKKHGDMVCVQPRLHTAGCQCNLDWIHSRSDYLHGRSKRNCHGEKSGREGAAALAAKRKPPPEVHAALR